MPNRRDFFKTVAGATAGMLVTGRGLANAGAMSQAAPVARREVSIGGKRVRVVDLHAHCAVPDVAAVVKGTAFEKNAGPAGARMLGQDRIELIDKQGIDIQALSINGFWWYGVTDRNLADQIVKAQNEGVAKWCRAHSDRFVGLSSSSLQHPELAAVQLDDGVKRLGMRGAAIGGHVNGESLSAAKYDPFWAKAAELGVIVFMHPGGADNIIKENSLEGPGDLGNIIGNPLETTFFLSKLIFDGTFDKFPNLKVCGAHGGGYLPSYFGRTEAACVVRNNAKCVNKRKPTEYLKQNIMADTMVFSEEALRHLVAEMGVSQVVYGTDNPLNWPVTVDLIVNSPSLSNADKEAILGGNLIKLLKIT